MSAEKGRRQVGEGKKKALRRSLLPRFAVRPRGNGPGMPRTAIRGRPAGFTLLEVVVALFIAGLALAVLFRAGSTGLYATDTAQKAEEAVERAQSHLAAIGREVALVAGVSEGEDGDGFRWRLSVHPLASRQRASANGASLVTTTLYDVEVAISWKVGGKTRRVVLMTRRLGAALAPR